jgi:tetratricopeptide (TPR) repeat protein
VSSAPASTTDQPSKTARAKALRLVNQADELVADVLPPERWEADPREQKTFLSGDAFERFLGLYLQAMELDALEPAYPWNLASTLRRLGRSDLALGFIGRAVRTSEYLGDEDWANPDAYFVWAETAIHAGQDELAFVAIAKATERAGNDEDARNHAVRLLAALAEARKGRHGHAEWPDAFLLVLLGSGASWTSEASSEEFAERTMKMLGRALKNANTKRTRTRNPA